MLAMSTDTLVNFYSRDELETLLLGVSIIRGVRLREGKNVSEIEVEIDKKYKEREREGQSRATSVTASSISPRAWAGVRNPALELSRC